VLAKLKVHPGSKGNRLIRKGTDAFEAWVREPPREGRATAAALELLYRELGHRRVRLVKGRTSPAKVVEIL